VDALIDSTLLTKVAGGPNNWREKLKTSVRAAKFERSAIAMEAMSCGRVWSMSSFLRPVHGTRYSGAVLRPSRTCQSGRDTSLERLEPKQITKSCWRFHEPLPSLGTVVLHDLKQNAAITAESESARRLSVEGSGTMVNVAGAKSCGETLSKRSLAIRFSRGPSDGVIVIVSPDKAVRGNFRSKGEGLVQGIARLANWSRRAGVVLPPGSDVGLILLPR